MFEPKSNSYLLGQDEAVKVLLEAWRSNSLHNSWIFSGPKGIGKATLAYKFAKFLLVADEGLKNKYESLDVPENNNIAKQVELGSCPDFKAIERAYSKTDTTKIIKAIKDGKPLDIAELAEFKKSSVIKIDEVREINDFLSKSSSNDGWRIVLVDSIDELNPAAANGILKILEEPPLKTIILLISHNPNKLLPTIKSRCAKLIFKPLEDNLIASLLRRYRSDLEENNLKFLAKISGGSIGKALGYAQVDLLEKYESLKKIVYAKNNFKLLDLLKFVDEATKSDENYDVTCEVILKFLNEHIKTSDNVEALSQAWGEIIKILDETNRLNLEKKQAIIKVINLMCEAV